MIKKITIRGIHEREAQKSESIRNYIEQKDVTKLIKLLDFVQEPVYLEITVDVHKPHPHHTCLIRIYGPRFELITKKEEAEAYKAIDDAFDQAVQNIINHKDKKVDSRKKG